MKYKRVHATKLLELPILVSGFLPKNTEVVRVEREMTTDYFRIYYQVTQRK